MPNNTTETKTESCLLIVLMQQPSSINAAISIKALIAIDIIPALVTIAANAILLLTIAKTKSLHTPANTLLAALCFTDLLVGAVSQPVNLAVLLQIEVFREKTEMLLVVSKWASIIFNGMSFFIVLFITIDRYVAVCHPFFYQQKLTIRAYAITVSLTWVYQLLAPIASGTYYMMLFSALTILSFGVMFFCYIRIYSIIAQKERSVFRLGEIGDDERRILRRNKEERSKAFTIIIILAVMIITYLPTLIVILAIFTPDQRTHFCKLSRDNYVLFVWSTFIFTLSSLINPIVYCIRIKSIKKATKDLVFCQSNRVLPY